MRMFYLLSFFPLFFPADFFFFLFFVFPTSLHLYLLLCTILDHHRVSWIWNKSQKHFGLSQGKKEVSKVLAINHKIYIVYPYLKRKISLSLLCVIKENETLYTGQEDCKRNRENYLIAEKKKLTLTWCLQCVVPFAFCPLWPFCLALKVLILLTKYEWLFPLLYLTGDK